MIYKEGRQRLSLSFVLKTVKVFSEIRIYLKQR